MLLEVKEVDAGYGKKRVLSSLSFNIDTNELVALMGPNGAGKTTTLASISGLIHPTKGVILFNEQDISRRTSFENVRQGISMIPQGGKVFKPLTVLENLEMGGYLLKSQGELDKSLERVYSLFPILKQRKFQLAETLSGGEQQMLAIGRGLMIAPKLLLLDEPSAGLAPIILRELMKVVSNVKKQTQTSILIVEQNVNEVLKIADRAYGMKLGTVIFHDESPENLLKNDKLRETYLS